MGRKQKNIPSLKGSEKELSKKANQSFFAKFILIIISVFLLLGLLKLVDLWIVQINPQVLEMLHEKPLANAQVIYPYSGFHLIPNHKTIGDGAGTSYKGIDVDVASGKHGFFIFDFDIDEPPPKNKNEFRIILIGGSSAQGWGARTNADMFYNSLQKQLNNEFEKQGVKLRIINMAMGSTQTYQNFLDLNKWGHSLNPDLILSFSGRNDLFHPLGHSHGTDLPQGMLELMCLADASQPWNNPTWLKFLGKFYPGLVGRFGIGIRMLIADDNAFEKYKSDFSKNFELDSQYANALKSIKRDFLGIPIVLVAQPYMAQLQFQQPIDYAGFMDLVYSKVNGYMNKDWYFLNMHRKWETEQKLGFPPMINYLQDYCHLNNKGHNRVTSDLIAFLKPIISRYIDDKKIDKTTIESNTAPAAD